LVEHAKKCGAKVIIRGLRAVADFEYEFQMAGMNSKLEPDLETIFLMASERLQLTSARFVKEIAFHNGKINNFVPKNVIKMFGRKMKGKK
jgi:pantetheine-phosphate adenylyltransferase